MFSWNTRQPPPRFREPRSETEVETEAAEHTYDNEGALEQRPFVRGAASGRSSYQSRVDEIDCRFGALSLSPAPFGAGSPMLGNRGEQLHGEYEPFGAPKRSGHAFDSPCAAMELDEPAALRPPSFTPPSHQSMWIVRRGTTQPSAAAWSSPPVTPTSAASREAMRSIEETDALDELAFALDRSCAVADHTTAMPYLY